MTGNILFLINNVKTGNILFLINNVKTGNILFLINNVKTGNILLLINNVKTGMIMMIILQWDTSLKEWWVSIWSLEWGYLKVSLLPSLAFHVPWPLRRCNSGLVYVSRYLKLEVGIWAQTHVNYLRFVVSYKWSQPLGH
jgi:hypothetical protein